jgi:hypothetical protein
LSQSSSERPVSRGRNCATREGVKDDDGNTDITRARRRDYRPRPRQPPPRQSTAAGREPLPPRPALFGVRPGGGGRDHRRGERPAQGARQFVYTQGDRADTVYVLKKGRIKLSVISESGKEFAIDIIQTGEIFGEFALLDESARSNDSVVITITPQSTTAVNARLDRAGFTGARALRRESYLPRTT